MSKSRIKEHLRLNQDKRLNELKTCEGCGETKKRKQFYFRKRYFKKFGVESFYVIRDICKKCFIAYTRKRAEIRKSPDYVKKPYRLRVNSIKYQYYTKYGEEKGAYLYDCRHKELLKKYTKIDTEYKRMKSRFRRKRSEKRARIALRAELARRAKKRKLRKKTNRENNIMRRMVLEKMHRYRMEYLKEDRLKSEKKIFDATTMKYKKRRERVARITRYLVSNEGLEPLTSCEFCGKEKVTLFAYVSGEKHIEREDLEEAIVWLCKDCAITERELFYGKRCERTKKRIEKINNGEKNRYSHTKESNKRTTSFFWKHCTKPSFKRQY